MGGGGGGTSIYICILGMCQRETPIFSPKFPLQSISFSHITNIFHTGASPFYIFAIPETIIFKFSSRTSRLLPPTAGLLQPAPAGSGRLECQPGASYKVSSGDPHFHAWAHSGASHFHVRARSGAPHFSLCRGTYLPKFGVSAPPPPRCTLQLSALQPRITFMITHFFKIMTLAKCSLVLILISIHQNMLLLLMMSMLWKTETVSQTPIQRIPEIDCQYPKQDGCE